MGKTLSYSVKYFAGECKKNEKPPDKGMSGGFPFVRGVF
jgi:predicted HicB family RNase H-like nuclease